MKYDVKLCKILRKLEIAPGIFDMLVDAEKFAKLAQPGQFAHILVPGKTLRRPISICNIDKEAGTLRFVFQIRGEGTDLLSQFKDGDDLNILAPLGHGFTLGDTSKPALFVGGGIGVPPLLNAAKAYGRNATVILGFRNADAAILEVDFARAGCRVFVATDDGSLGHHGLVTDCMEGVDASVIYACGPTPMLKAVCKVAEQRNVPCQISLEERMACGIGACLGCACKLKHEDGTEYYGHVCKDGPVFDAKTIVWER
ncbi:MAG TPA: dihydroorotate dehydrogenase electron transfer subunit [Oscillospiraceae bacterium]|nr:dihydroorotate dehydrogenase electron transfer subunit [Oscillospiraceae bacterium]